MIASPRLRSGVVALVLLSIVVGVAVFRHRGWARYELWRASHGIMACAALALTLHHAVVVGTYSQAPVLRAVWALYLAAATLAVAAIYIVRPLKMWRGNWRIESTSALADGVTEVVLKAPDRKTFNFRGGQFIWMTVSPHRPPFHDHPFSIASCAAQLPRLRLIVRHAGDCTDHFGHIEPGTDVAVDGPHGSFVLPPGPESIVMIAGGVGIAPILGMLEEAAANRDRRRFRLLLAARNPSALAGLKRLHEIKGQLDLTVTCLVDGGALPHEHLAGPFCEGHVRTLLKGLRLDGVAAMLCGPARLMELAADTLLKLGVPARSIHYERFDYAAGKGTLDKRRRTGAMGILAVLVAAVALFAVR